ncbi:MAG: leucine-rich repeat domain-containing protein [Prevotellaceae bacterium]|jgi:hypothetical protein|nr:leucine-rich repeat domain-containing protein [Prevotellaceae bacterium]
MKKNYLFAFLSVLLLSFAVISCGGDDDGDDSGGGGNGGAPAGDLKAGQVQIKGYANSNSKKITFYATAKKLVIDWGDEQKEEIVPNGVGRTFSHEYENVTNFQTISINTEDLIEIGFGKNYYNDYDGDIYELRLGNCPKLKTIGLNYSSSSSYVPKLTVFEINRAESLEYLEIRGTDLTELILNGCINLVELTCYGNDKLTSLDVSGCTKLVNLTCGITIPDGLDSNIGNNLTSLDVSKCTKLEYLDCSDNQLTSLDVSKCTKLESLSCRGNQLTSLDVSVCINLKSLDCGNSYYGPRYYNKLTSLDVSKCTKLTNVNCRGNQLSATALNSLFASLPVPAVTNARIYYGDNPGTESCNTSIATNKGWYVNNW